LKKKITVIILVLLALSFAVTTYAVERRKINLVAGEVKALDTKTKMLTLKENGKPDFSCFITDKTVLRMDKGRKTADQIKVGDIAVLIYQEMQGQKIATSITIATPHDSPSAEKKGTPEKYQEKQ